MQQTSKYSRNHSLHKEKKSLVMLQLMNSCRETQLLYCQLNLFCYHVHVNGKNYVSAGPAESVQLVRALLDQYLRLCKVFRVATYSCRLEIYVLVTCKLSAGDAGLM